MHRTTRDVIASDGTTVPSGTILPDVTFGEHYDAYHLGDGRDVIVDPDDPPGYEDAIIPICHVCGKDYGH